MTKHFLKNKSDITAWLDKYGVENYTLTPDSTYGYTVEVKGRVNLSHKNLNLIPVKFSLASWDFYCNNNALTTLEFCPKTVGYDFRCQDNQLTSLEFCPQVVGGFFDCTNNQINSLEFCPQQVNNGFYCYDNPQLGHYQDMNNFSAILKIQIEALIQEEKNKLEQNLPTNAHKEPLALFKI